MTNVTLLYKRKEENMSDYRLETEGRDGNKHGIPQSFA